MFEIKADRRNGVVLLSIKNIDNNTRRGMRQAFFQYGNDLKKTASKQILKKPKSGQLYRIRRGKIRRNHRASAPGESPANLSGNYRRSIGFKIYGDRKMTFGASARSKKGAPYASFLENGTRKMKPRPGLGNAVKATEKNAVNYFVNNIDRNLK